ncbi:insulin-degrading enzyme-like [Pogonomyrmex barbatus]|uniref:Insulin-degrading enzyme-like n=1 Tax=Pogonomyrmex barbatus TaxID=144034 RepID=A0A6I9W5F0_9HYME|nr:insulin-degrading enzyme-like [Pogonomyrmex barbatus]
MSKFSLAKYKAECDRMKNLPHRYNYISSSENDNRLYRGIKLCNEMNVLLISDPNTDKAATSMNICVGTEGDPRHLPGLAHLCTHALYLTKEETPQKYFRAFVEMNHGSINAETNANDTSYFFDIHPTKFVKALTYFANVFVKPHTFTKATIEVEASNLKHEYESKKFDEKWRLLKMFRWAMDGENGKFDIGCTETLLGDFIKKKEINIVKVLKTFHERHYYAKVMNLCILGKESLDKLENLAIKLFSRVRKVGVPAEHYSPPRSPSMYKIYFVPHGTYKRLYVTFEFHHSSNEPYNFFIYLFEYDGKKSLTSVLKAKGWGNSVEAGFFPQTNESLFVIIVDLTTEGLEHVDDVMTMLFQYINMLKNSNDKLKRVYNEYKEIMELKFRFKKKESPLIYVKNISQIMRKCSIKFVLREKIIGKWMWLREWQRDDIEKILNHFLSPLCIRIFVGANKYESIINEIEPWCGQKFKVEEIPMVTCAKWTNAPYHAVNLDLPPANEFIPIPSMINVKPHKGARAFPKIIRKTQLMRLWHKKDDKFNDPRATIILHFISPFAFKNSTSVSFTLMFVHCINKSLSEYVYPAALVDLRWKLSATIHGILLEINGFDNTLHVLLEKIIDRMINFNLKPQNFEAERQENIRLNMEELKKIENSPPYRQAQHYLSFLLTHNFWEKQEILGASYNIDFEKTRLFISKFFSTIYVEGLIYGNITKAEARDTADKIENKLNKKVLSTGNLEIYHDIKLENDHHFIFYKEIKQSLSCLLIFYQIKTRMPRMDVYLDIAQEIFNDHFYKTLKNKEKIDLSGVGVHRSFEMQGLMIMIQGEKDYLENGIEKYILTCMHYIMCHIKEMSKDAFENIKESLLLKYSLREPKTLNDLANFLWTEIENQHYNFNRNEDKVKNLLDISLPDFQYFFKVF